MKWTVAIMFVAGSGLSLTGAAPRLRRAGWAVLGLAGVLGAGVLARHLSAVVEWPSVSTLVPVAVASFGGVAGAAIVFARTLRGALQAAAAAAFCTALLLLTREELSAATAVALASVVIAVAAIRGGAILDGTNGRSAPPNSPSDIPLGPTNRLREPWLGATAGGLLLVALGATLPRLMERPATGPPHDVKSRRVEESHGGLPLPPLTTLLATAVVLVGFTTLAPGERVTGEEQSEGGREPTRP